MVLQLCEIFLKERCLFCDGGRRGRLFFLGGTHFLQVKVKRLGNWLAMVVCRVGLHFPLLPPTIFCRQTSRIMERVKSCLGLRCLE